MRDLVILPAKEGKGRSFQATLLAYVTADSLWEGGQSNTETTRPVWMMLGGTENELRPFVANLQLGRKAELLSSGYRKNKGSDKFEVLKSVGYQTAWQRTPVGSAVTIFLPDLFRLDPGMVDPKGVEFCILPAKSWLEGITVEEDARNYAQAIIRTYDKETLVSKDLDLEYLLKIAPLFIGYLDRRTRCPLVPDQRFYIQVLLGFLNLGLASWSTDDSYYRRNWGRHRGMGFVECDTLDVGLSAGIVFKSSHVNLEKFLAEQVEFYFDRVR